ncbi:MAG TPA: TolC family protein, partial [Pseudomonas sp.]|nr:TolC family protein [Pseudomonas sp.]
MNLPSRLSVLSISLFLAACSTNTAPPSSGLQAPAAWQGHAPFAQPLPELDWWQQFSSAPLNQLIAQAQRNSFDLAAAAARVRQAQASAVIAGAPLLPEVKFGLDGSRQHLLHGNGFDQLDASNSERTSTSFSTRLSASYEIDFWGGKAAARDSALFDLDASRYDRQTVELTLLSGVANSYLQSLALAEQVRIARLNLANAQDVLRLVQTRYDS